MRVHRHATYVPGCGVCAVRSVAYGLRGPLAVAAALIAVVAVAGGRGGDGPAAEPTPLVEPGPVRETVPGGRVLLPGPTAPPESGRSS